MRKNSLLLGLLLTASTSLFAQSPSTSITTWKNDAKGCYNIIHDDYGDWSTPGIQNYADSMHFNRGLKFTFGAITLSCEQNTGVYAIAKTMIKNHGHEIINHSHTHSCAVGNSKCGGTGTNYQWAVPGATDKLSVEVDYSHNSITTNTGYTPRYFIFPYDQYNDNANNYLKSKGYIGSRSGKFDTADFANFAPDAEGFFRPTFITDVKDVNGGTYAVNLNAWVDTAIVGGKHVSRELHNIGSSGWGSVTVADYRTHLNYVKSKVTSGDLWVGTISEILTYQIQKLNYTNANTVYSAQNKEINISWPTPAFDVATYLSPLQVKSPVTIKVNLDGLTATDYIITQASKYITSKKIVNGILYFDAYPHEGPIKIALFDCQTVCISINPEDKTATQGDANVSLSVSAVSSIGAITYQWMKNNVNISNAKSATLTLSNIALADDASYSVKVTAGGTTIISNAAKLTVKSVFVATSTPYTTSMPIPGKIEAEFYDLGGQGNAYNDLTNTNLGNATSFRSGTSVDIENCIDGGVGYDIGYTAAGEWLNYTVDVAATQNYDLEIRYATTETGTLVKLTLNNDPIATNIGLPNTGSWKTYKSVFVNNIPLTAGLNKILRFEMVNNGPNLNYYTFTKSPITSLTKDSPKVKLNLFPNPTTAGFTVTGIEEGTIQILNIEGNVIKEYHIASDQNSLEIDENLNQGVYFVKYIGKNISQSIRLIKL